MSGFYAKAKYALIRFMQGRHGADNLSRASVLAGLILTMVGMFVGANIVGTLFSYAGIALYIWSIFRIFSRNNEKRWRENAKYTQLMGQARLSARQMKTRFKNRREYRYFRCPDCKAWLRLKRGAGEGTVTCGKCGKQFRMRA